MENLGIGLQLMAVGMITVFAILLIVINGSRLLITLVNKFAPEPQASPKKQTSDAAPGPGKSPIDAQTMAILTQAVAQLTDGKGRIVSAEKL